MNNFGFAGTLANSPLSSHVVIYQKPWFCRMFCILQDEKTKEKNDRDKENPLISFIAKADNPLLETKLSEDNILMLLNCML